MSICPEYYELFYSLPLAYSAVVYLVESRRVLSVLCVVVVDVSSHKMQELFIQIIDQSFGSDVCD